MEYFVSYVHKEQNEINFGNHQISINEPKSIRDVETMARWIERSMNFSKGSVVILSYQPFKNS